MDDEAGVGAFLTFAARAAQIASLASGAPDEHADEDFRRSCPEAWWAFHDRRGIGEDTVQGQGAEVKLSWNGIAYDVVLVVRQTGLQCRFQLDRIDDLVEDIERVLTGRIKVGWTRWEPFKGTQAARELAERKQRARQAKKS